MTTALGARGERLAADYLGRAGLVIVERNVRLRAGEIDLVARDGDEMTRRMREVHEQPALAAELRANGLETIRSRHTCAHRVDELLAIAAELDPRHAGMLEVRA